ncbi:MAG TPA: YraN family protein [Acidimicrobiia bacterium]|nr:YraN family protein [Acidimicrobiia bacterium]
MGLGHVPAGTFSRESPGAHIPRRERGEAGEDRAQALTDHRPRIGAAGEWIAAHWLTEQGLIIERRNVILDDGEIDLIVRDEDIRVAIEVRTITGSGDPIDAVNRAKRRRVASLARKLGVARVDLVGVGLRDWGVEVHWVPGGTW